MKTLRINALVTGPEFDYEETHRWGNIPPVLSDWLDKKLAEAASSIAKFASKGGDLNVKLSAVIDGKSLPDQITTGVRSEDVENFQDKFDDWGRELRKMSRDARKHGNKHRK